MTWIFFDYVLQLILCLELIFMKINYKQNLVHNKSTHFFHDFSYLILQLHEKLDN